LQEQVVGKSFFVAFANSKKILVRACLANESIRWAAGAVSERFRPVAIS
jgi:hypothetical protein